MPDVIIPLEDLMLLRIAAGRWAREHPTNPNCPKVARAVKSVYPASKWIREKGEKEIPDEQ